MALSKNSVKKAADLLKKINPKIKKANVIQADDVWQTDIVIGHDKKKDGGYETVFTNIKDIEPEQITAFNSLAGSTISNTSFVDPANENGITRIGFY